jgi:BirA family biotin operon repressor/biotin-[acetyl-CoA-carboxylase] ligase
MRPGLDAAAVRDAVVRAAGLWTSVTVVDETGSTNADLLACGTAATEGAVLVAESQTAGRGRLGRLWVSPPRAALTFSVLLRPAGVPVARLGWLPLLTGVAVVTAVRDVAGLDARLKWPNDVVVGGRKLAGILSERSPTGDVVVGTGLNVSTGSDELPPPGPGALPATSLAIEGASDVTRETLLMAVLGECERRYLAFRDGVTPAQEYRRLCATLGREVRSELPGDRTVTGVAEDVDDDGRLLVRPADGSSPIVVAAGDVVHLR